MDFHDVHLSFRKDVESFLNKDTHPRLMLYAENGRDYIASVQPPSKYKKKAMYFVKTDPVAVTPENINDKVTYGDAGEAPLETLSSVASNVFLPLLTSPGNQVGWPEVLSKEVSDSLHKFTANIFVTIGQTKGQTMLPLPAGAFSTLGTFPALYSLYVTLVLVWYHVWLMYHIARHATPLWHNRSDVGLLCRGGEPGSRAAGSPRRS